MSRCVRPCPYPKLASHPYPWVPLTFPDPYPTAQVQLSATRAAQRQVIMRDDESDAGDDEPVRKQSPS